MRAIAELDSVKPENEDQKTGIEIIRQAIQVPTRQIVSNAGLDGAVVVNEILKDKDFNYGYNAADNTYGDMMKAGVIDPTKIVKAGLKNAASVTGLLLTTECVIAEDPDNQKEHNHDMPNPGMDMY